MQPYYSHAGITIYHGDNRDVLPTLEPESIDLLLTDPPYGMQFHGQGLKTAKANVKGDGARAGVRIVRQTMFELVPLMAVDAHLYVFCHWESWPDFYDAISPLAPIKSALIWWKKRGGMGDTDMEYARDYEVILYAAHNHRALAGRRDGAVISGIPPCGNDRIHPTEKPIELCSYLIEKSCPVGGMVIDPFMGSGPSLLAAKLLGRKAIGVEIEERWCEAAAKRLQQEVLPMGGDAPIPESQLTLAV